MNEESEAARISKVFASTTVRPFGASAPAETIPNAVSSSDEAYAQNGHARLRQCLIDRRTTSSDRVTRSASPYIVHAGSVIPAALITGLRSDLSGQIIAQVTESIFGTPTGRSLLR